MTSMNTPTKGEIWLLTSNEPKKGSRSSIDTVVVVSAPVFPLRIGVPIIGWKPAFEGFPWLYRLKPSKQNGLHQVSGADSLQVRSLPTTRFQKRLGSVTTADLQAIVDGILLCIS